MENPKGKIFYAFQVALVGICLAALLLIANHFARNISNDEVGRAENQSVENAASVESDDEKQNASGHHAEGTLKVGF